MKKQDKLLNEHKLKGEEEQENRKAVAIEHMSSQGTYTLKEYYDHCMLCVCVYVCHTVGGVFMNYHTVYL